MGRNLRLRRLRAYLVLVLLPPRRSTQAALTVIAAFAFVGWLLLIGLKRGQDIYVDSAEAFAWGQRFLGGYGRHPPLTGWIAGLWYLVFPAEKWASFALSRVMCAICLTGIYLVARRVMDARRALLVVLVMMAYPFFFGAKSDRYNNYQVLQTVIPFVVLFFLIAYEKRTALPAALLGVAGAAATMTIYSGLFGLVSTGTAALLHPDRKRFLTSTAPYIAVAVFFLALLPHLIWLYQHDFASIRFANRYTGTSGKTVEWQSGFNYLLHHAALVGIPVAVGLVSLWPWRFRLSIKREDRLALLLAIVVAVLAIGPVIAFFVFHVHPTVDWGNPFFSLIPVAMLAGIPGLVVTRRAVANAAITVVTISTVYLAVSTIYPAINFRMRPDYRSFEPAAELVRQVTEAWRDRMHSPLQIVVSDLVHSTKVAFYSTDHPRPLPDFLPWQVPWIDFPADLQKFGYVGICELDNKPCASLLSQLDPQIASIKPIQLTASRSFAGVTGPPYTWEVWIVPPQR